jgi:hypothetical protein
VNTRRLNLLSIAGTLTFLAALVHIGCIVYGGDGYRFLGAGEHMATLAESGDPYPSVITGTISAILMIWSAYAFSGAGIIVKLPFVRLALVLISTVLLVRALGFYFIMSAFPENTLTFWLVSSCACLILGLLYALGLKQRWSAISSVN